jgi:hypothetical protein
MYDGHSDPKQFLMSYEATISSYGGNTAVMAKSFVMAVRNVAQTWYSSLQPGTITSWQKLKDMLVTSFQGFRTKPVIAQALFQCTQDHEEYLQAYVRRFLRLRGQAPTVPNEIVIEAMIKGLRPGPTAQYFVRKPPQTLEKLLQKMDKYIRADNDFRQRREEAYRFFEMTRGFGGRVHPRHVRSIHSSSQNDDKGSQFQRPQHTSQSLGQQQSSFRPLAPRGRGTRGFGGRYGDQPRKIYCLFYGEDKGHTTRTCQITILKQKEIAESAKASPTYCFVPFSAESAKASPTYCFVPFSLHTRICGQPTCSFCCFGKPFTGFLASAPTATTTATYSLPKPIARRAPALPSTT